MRSQTLNVAVLSVVASIPVAWALSVVFAERAPPPRASASRPSVVVSNSSRSAGRASPIRRHPPSPSRTVDDPEDAQSDEARTLAKHAHARKEERAFVEAFQGEARHSAWAQTWEARLDTRIKEGLASADGFSNAHIECRRSKCIAQTTWDNYEAAQMSLEATVTMTQGECGTFVFLPPPEDPSRSYSHTIRFDGCRQMES